MKQRLSLEEIQAAAREYQIELSLLQTLIDAESGGSGFLSDSQVKIFERQSETWLMV